MRFHANGPVIPDVLLERSDEGQVVFLCGAGVSITSGMPSFTGLTRHVLDFFDPPENSEIMGAFRPWRCDPTGTNVPLDQIFNLLHLEYGRDEVNALVTERLKASAGNDQAGNHHSLIKRISTSPNGTPQIVTTNFDLLFEQTEPGDNIPIHVAPAFPHLAAGNSVEGITYLHGRLADQDAEHHPYVLSSADFGRAYLSEAWATNFIRNLLERYTVVLVGYQAEDPPIKYLLQGLNHDGQFDRTRLFAFDQGAPEDIEAKWRDRGVSAIAYPGQGHDELWQTMEAWADRADDPRAWRSSVIATTRQDPKTLEPYERGQVAHVVRSTRGAKLLAEIKHPTHPEWICVFSGAIRSARPVKRYDEVFEPNVAYGLDDDQNPSDDILSWRHGDENPPDAHRLGRTPHGPENLPSRLRYLVQWIGANFASPVIAWWAIKQDGLHPCLLDHFGSRLFRDRELQSKARNTWRLIIESHKDPRNRERNYNWINFERRVANEGWTPSVLREFGRIVGPRLVFSHDLASIRPPHADWPEIKLSDLGRFEVKFLERDEEYPVIPDEVLPQTFGMLENAMIAASGMLLDIETAYFKTPTCYPDREVDGEAGHSNDAKPFTLFRELFDRMVAIAPQAALGHFLTWPKEDRFIFRKLGLYALSKQELFNPDAVAEQLLALNQEIFWDDKVSRELLFLLVDRWTTFSESNQKKLGERLLAGPDKARCWSKEDYPNLRYISAAIYARYLQIQGCVLIDNQGERLSSIISKIPDWRDDWATSTVREHGFRIRPVKIDETPDLILGLPVDEIVPRAKEDLQEDPASFELKRPFTGLVKNNPRKALSALTAAARQNDYPSALWSDLITEMPEDISPGLKRVFWNRLARLPHFRRSEIEA